MEPVVRIFGRRVFSASLALAGALLVMSIPALASTAGEPSNDPAAFLQAPPVPMAIKGPFSVVSVGDLLYAHPLATLDDPEFRKVLATLRSGDVAIANQEGVFIDLATFQGPAYGHGQLWGEGSLPGDIKALGIDMVSVAGNHATDFGARGLMETLRLLDVAGVVHAGSGATLAQARAAGLLTKPGGVVGLVATASTYKVDAGANDAFAEGETPARPGISALRTRTIVLVEPDQLATVRALATELASPLEPPPAADATEVSFGERTYRLSDRKGLHYDMDLYDHAGLLRSVREAKARAGLVAFTIHAHESPTGVDDDTPEPPDFLVRLSHDVIDAGADIVMGGGPHALRGIEIYKGKPILYGLGIFLFKAEIKAMQETVFREFPPLQVEPPDPRPNSPRSWFDSVIAITDFDGGRVQRVRLYPIDLMNQGSTPSRRGIPHFARGADAQRILKKLQLDSAPFGTRITIAGDTGIIALP